MKVINSLYKLASSTRSIYKGREYLTILVYFALLFVLDYSGIMNLYGQNFVRRMINMYRRRDPLTYQSKLKPFCEPSKKMLSEEDIKKLQSIKVPETNDMPWFSRKNTTTHQCCDKFSETEKQIITEISEKVRQKYEKQIGKTLHYMDENSATIYVYHGKHSQHLWHVDPQNLREIFNVIICFKKVGALAHYSAKTRRVRCILFISKKVTRRYSMAELLFIRFLQMKTTIRNERFYPSHLQPMINTIKAKTCVRISRVAIIM